MTKLRGVCDKLVLVRIFKYYVSAGSLAEHPALFNY